MTLFNRTCICQSCSVHIQTQLIFTEFLPHIKHGAATCKCYFFPPQNSLWDRWSSIFADEETDSEKLGCWPEVTQLLRGVAGIRPESAQLEVVTYTGSFGRCWDATWVDWIASVSINLVPGIFTAILWICVIWHLYRVENPDPKGPPKLAHSKPAPHMCTVSRGDCKIYTTIYLKWDQPICKVQILLFLPSDGTPPLLAKVCIRFPWCFSQCLRLLFLNQS